MQNIRYPKIFIRSKTELERHISHKGFPRGVALSLINDTITHFNEYWKDNKKYSNPAKGKYVRNAKGTPLGLLLKKINERILCKEMPMHSQTVQIAQRFMLHPAWPKG